MAHLQSQEASGALPEANSGRRPDWAERLAEIASQGIAVFSCRMLSMADGFHFEVELDGLHDPHGAVTLGDCEEFSRRFCERLDREIELAADGSGDPNWKALLPAGLTIDNYSLEVASAGAEREIRLPQELERFRGLPLKLKWRPADPERSADERVEVVVFEGRDEESDAYRFRRYTPTGGKSRRALKRQGKRPPSRKAEPHYEVREEELAQANLYLDF